MPRTECLTLEELKAWHLGNLDDSVQDELTDHVDQCSQCEKAAEALDGISDPLLGSLLRTAREHAPNAEKALPRRIGNYEVLELLGQGGMGIVYKVRHVQLHKVAAVKMLRQGAFADPEDRRRFRLEAEAIARLQHAHIIQIHDIGEWQPEEGGPPVPYFALEYIEGGNLAKRSIRVPPPRLTAAWLESLARAAHYAHEQGIIHRDLKPANILLAGDGTPKLCDFGVAKLVAGSDLKTMSGMLLGTAEYMAPEQARGQAAAPTTDVYSLGAILYDLLTGRPPFQGTTTLDTLRQVEHAEPVPPRRLQPFVPRDLETICLTCLEKEPRRRYATAEALADDLHRFLALEPIRARPPSAWHRAGMFVKRNKALTGGVTATAAALLLGIVATSLMALSESRERSRAEANAAEAVAAGLESQFKAYQARLAAGFAALGDDNIGEAAEQLAEAPESMRGWEWRHLQARLDDSLSEVHGLGSYVVLHPAAARLAAVTENGIGFWQEQGNNWAPLAGDLLPSSSLAPRPVPFRPTGRVELLAWSPQGNLVLGAELYRSHFLMDATGRIRWSTTSLITNLAETVAFDSTGTRLACWRAKPSGRAEFSLYDLTAQRLTGPEPCPSETIRCLAFSPDGHQVAGGDEGGEVSFWDPITCKRQAVMRGHTGFVNALAYSPDGRRLLSCSADQTIREWDVAARQLIDVRHGHVASVSAIAYSPDGRWIASAGTDCTIRLWRTSGGPAAAVLHGHATAVRQVGFSRKGDHILSVDARGGVRVWDSPDRSAARILRGHTSFVYPVCYSPDGRWIASGGWDNVIRLWDALTGEQVAVLAGHTKYVADVAFSPDGQRLVSRSADKTVRLWDADTGRALAVWPDSGTGTAETRHSIAISPDGRFVVSAQRNSLVVRPLSADGPVREMPVPSDWTNIFSFSPDGREIAVVGQEPNIYVVDAATGTPRLTLAGHTEIIHSVTWDARGDRLLSASRDRTARLWDAATGECLQVLRSPTGDVFSAVFHPDGQRIASAGRDRMIRLWDIARGAVIATLKGHSDYIFTLQFSPDGSSLASSSGDYTVRLWDDFPVARRLQARRATESQRADAEKLVGKLLRGGLQLTQVAESLRANLSVPESLRRACWHVLLAQASESAGR